MDSQTIVSFATCPVCREPFNIEGRQNRIFDKDKCADRASNALMILKKRYKAELHYLQMYVKRNHYGAVKATMYNEQITNIICKPKTGQSVDIYTELDYGTPPQFLSPTLTFLLNFAKLAIVYCETMQTPLADPQFKIYFGQMANMHCAKYGLTRDELLQCPCEDMLPF